MNLALIVVNITRPKKAEEPKPEPTPEPVKKSGGTWLYIFIRKYISLRKLPFCGKQTTTLLNEVLRNLSYSQN